jgi:hypothetical protein
MKIIITESQKNNVKKGLLELINLYGFKSVAESQGMSKLQLAKMVDLPIKGDTFFDKNEVVVGQLLKDLVNLDDVYNECDLIYDFMSGTIHWNCTFNDGEQIINTLTYATPYYNDNNMTPVDTDEFEVIKDGESETYGGMSNEYSTGIHSPTEFENVNVLIKWFEDDYKPVVYKAIKRHLKEFKEEYNL